MTQPALILAPVEKHLAYCRQQIGGWLVQPDYIPSTEEVEAIRQTLKDLLHNPIPVQGTSQAFSLCLAELDTRPAAQLPSELWQRLQQLQGEVMAFDRDLEAFCQRLDALNANKAQHPAH